MVLYTQIFFCHTYTIEKRYQAQTNKHQTKIYISLHRVIQYDPTYAKNIFYPELAYTQSTPRIRGPQSFYGFVVCIICCTRHIINSFNSILFDSSYEIAINSCNSIPFHELVVRWIIFLIYISKKTQNQGPTGKTHRG